MTEILSIEGERILSPEELSPVAKEHNHRVIKASAAVLSLFMSAGIPELAKAGLLPVAASDISTGSIETTIDVPSAAPLATYEKTLENNTLSDGLLRSGLTYASFWVYTRAIDAEYLNSLVPGREQKANIRMYRESLNATASYEQTGSKKYPGGFAPSFVELPFIYSQPQRFVDDNLWGGLLFIRQYKNSHNPADLAVAENVMHMVTSQWCKNGGGVYWQEQLPGTDNRARALVSNAPAVELATDLYRFTGNQSYLNWAEKIYRWINATLRDNKTGEYYDHIDGNHLDKKYYTYGMGSVTGAQLALNSVLPEEYPLSEIVEQANASLNYAVRHHLYGNSTFDAIYFKNLLSLSSVAHDPTLTHKIKTSVKYAIEDAPKNSTDLSQLEGIDALKAMQRIPASKYGLLSADTRNR